MFCQLTSSHAQFNGSWSIWCLQDNKDKLPKSINTYENLGGSVHREINQITRTKACFSCSNLEQGFTVAVCSAVSYLLHTGQCSPASCCASRCRDTLAPSAPRCSCPELCSETLCTHSGFHSSGHERAAPGYTTEKIKRSKLKYLYQIQLLVWSIWELFVLSHSPYVKHTGWRWLSVIEKCDTPSLAFDEHLPSIKS